MDAISFSYNWNPWVFWIVLIICVVGAVLLSRVPLLWMVAWAVPALIVYYGVGWEFPLDGLFKWVFWIVFLVVLFLPIFGLKIVPFGFISGLFIFLLLLDFVVWGMQELGDAIDGEPTVQVEDAPDVVDDPSDEPSELETSSPLPSPTSSSSSTASPSSTGSPSGDPSPTSSPTSDGDGEEADTDTRHYNGQIPSIPQGTCPGMLGWDTLVDCVEDNNLQWYINGVNARADETGFDWSDVVNWANARTLDGRLPEVRYIQVFGNSISDNEARTMVYQQTGEYLRVVRQPACFNNTEGIEVGQLENFSYCPKPDRQVRISLMPLQLDGEGHALYVNDMESGVFVDCLNVWWTDQVVGK